VTSLIRAASDGNAPAVKALLAEGTNIDGSTPGGQTPLMLAAFFGRADIVRLLLEAGADVELKDGLGLSAREWAERRGFSEIIELLAKEREAGAGGRRHSAAEAKVAPEQDVRRPTDELAEIKADLESPTAAEAIPTTEDLARVEGGLESPSSLQEPETPVEEQDHMKSLPELRDLVPEERPSQPSNPPAAPETRASESLNPSDFKLCPKCNTIYKSELLAYCSYDATPLLSTDDARFNSPAAPGFNSPEAPAFEWQTLWVLVAITVVGSAFFAYLLNNYVAVETPSAPMAVQTEERANANVLPTVGGALSGKEINLPLPEYPAHVKSEGISGMVTVVVRVNKKGVVISARALNGNPLLQAAALEAAKRASFSPQKLAAQGEVVSGTITYTFKL
jgi:TonB family protein